MTDGLKDTNRKKIIDILSANPRVKRAVLFGSRALGTHTQTSDVDIALFGEELSLDDLGSLSAQMEQLSMPQQVDLVIVHRIDNKKLVQHILDHGVQWFPAQ